MDQVAVPQSTESVPSTSDILGKAVVNYLDTLLLNDPSNPVLIALRVRANEGLVVRPAAIMCGALLGDKAGSGFDITKQAPLKFPEDHFTHFQYHDEWYFLVSLLDIEGGGKIALVTMMMRNGLVSPAIAKQCGWSEDKNTTLDTQCNISIVGASGKTQYVRLPILVQGGPNGDFSFFKPGEPFNFQQGKNYYRGDPNNVFPLVSHLEGIGSRSEKVQVDLQFEQTQPFFLQGDNGFVSVVPGAKEGGWFYYSWPFLKTHGTIKVDGTTFQVNGQSWMDHQFGSGPQKATEKRQPNEAPKRPIIASVQRALTVKGPQQQRFTGWVWFAFHLSDGAALTLSGPHSDPDEPPPVTVPFVAGKYIGPGPDYADFVIVGTLELTAWATSPLTGAQIPAGWKFNLQFQPNTSGASPPHKTISWEVTPWYPTPCGMFNYLPSEYCEGGGDVKGSYDGTVPFGGRGFCESVGFEPSCTYNPRISNAVDLEPILP